MSISPANRKHVNAFVKQLKATYPIPATFTLSFLDEPSRVQGKAAIYRESKKVICKLYSLQDVPLAKALRTIAHEYKHAHQFFVDKKSTLTPESEEEACRFGFHKATAYCKKNGIEYPREVCHPAIGLVLMGV